MRVAMISRASLFEVPGGDTVQIQETASALLKLGTQVDILLASEKINYQNYDLLHFFNVIRPNGILPHVKAANKPFVVSTIFVDYTEVEEKLNGWKLKLLLKVFGSDCVEYIKTIGRSIINNESLLDWGYLFRGHKKSVEKALNQASMLLPNSENEYKRLQVRYSFKGIYRVIPNAVNSAFLEDKWEQLKRANVVCVARIEPIKNQLNLIRALKNSNIKLELIGKPSPNHQAYYEQCKAEATANIEFLGQKTRDEVILKLAEAKVHILPSWFETTGLSSLEAGALGCAIVVTGRGDTKDYFKELAYYCDPDSPDSIREKIQEALNSKLDSSLRNHIKEIFRWEITAKKTLAAYHEVLNNN